jgi:hypothetical protein
MTGDTQIYNLLKVRNKALSGLVCILCAWIADASAAEDADGPPIHFYADLSADEQSAVTDSPALGRADFILERATLRFSWVVTYSDLTSAPTAAGLHGPQTPGGNAGLLVDIAESGLGSPIKGSTIITDGELDYMLTGKVYVNLRTVKFDLGELRGQIMRKRPSEVEQEEKQ